MDGLEAAIMRAILEKKVDTGKASSDGSALKKSSSGTILYCSNAWNTTFGGGAPGKVAKNTHARKKTKMFV